MRKSSWARFFASRIVRIGIYCAILLVLAAIAFYFDHNSLGLSFVVAALAMGGAFFIFVIRPARIPRDTVLTIRLSGALPEEPSRSIIDQIRGKSPQPGNFGSTTFE